MKFAKKSLGQNFLIDKNIISKILNLTNLKGKDIIEIGPGKGALTDEIIKKRPRSLTIIEKDNNLVKYLKAKYFLEKKIKVIHEDILKFNFSNINYREMIIIGNLPYNISSQVLIKIIKCKNFEKKFNNLIFMFQKELGEKILGKFPSKNYGRLSIISNLRLNLKNKFLVSSNCFFPKPKVTSMVIHFTPEKNNYFNFKEISNLEKITNTLFSNRRKIIKKNIKKILDDEKLKKIPELDLNLRPEKISPKIYYKITELYEKN